MVIPLVIGPKSRAIFRQGDQGEAIACTVFTVHNGVTTPSLGRALPKEVASSVRSGEGEEECGLTDASDRLKTPRPLLEPLLFGLYRGVVETDLDCRESQSATLELEIDSSDPGLIINWGADPWN
jgi:hypothetical protein